MPCDPNLLASINMFELLNEDDRVTLGKVIDELSVPEGHTLFQAGDPGDSLFIVQSGEIELFIKDTAGQKIVLTNAQNGDMFGEPSTNADSAPLRVQLRPFVRVLQAPDPDRQFPPDPCRATGEVFNNTTLQTSFVMPGVEVAGGFNHNETLVHDLQNHKR